jgi:hypothetical protein
MFAPLTVPCVPCACRSRSAPALNSWLHMRALTAPALPQTLGSLIEQSNTAACTTVIELWCHFNIVQPVTNIFCLVRIS